MEITLHSPLDTGMGAYNYDVFLSHNRGDAFSRAVADMLRAQNVKAFWDDAAESDLADRRVRDRLAGALANSRFVAVVVGPAYRDSVWCQAEQRDALLRSRGSGRKSLIVLLCGGRTDVPRSIVDYRDDLPVFSLPLESTSACELLAEANALTPAIVAECEAQRQANHAFIDSINRRRNSPTLTHDNYDLSENVRSLRMALRPPPARTADMTAARAHYLEEADAYWTLCVGALDSTDLDDRYNAIMSMVALAVYRRSDAWLEHVLKELRSYAYADAIADLCEAGLLTHNHATTVAATLLRCEGGCLHPSRIRQGAVIELGGLVPESVVVWVERGSLSLAPEPAMERLVLFVERAECVTEPYRHDPEGTANDPSGLFFTEIESFYHFVIDDLHLDASQTFRGIPDSEADALGFVSGRLVPWDEIGDYLARIGMLVLDWYAHEVAAQDRRSPLLIGLDEMIVYPLAILGSRSQLSSNGAACLERAIDTAEKYEIPATERAAFRALLRSVSIASPDVVTRFRELGMTLSEDRRRRKQEEALRELDLRRDDDHM